MATMHSLFFGVLFVSVLFLGGFGHSAIMQEMVGNQPRSMAIAARPKHNGTITSVRERIMDIAIGEIGITEATGNNDGAKVEEYLVYTGLGKGYAWCAAFVSWCYGKAGLAAPRSAWSPALFPMARRYTGQQVREGRVRSADLFAIYNHRLARIDHVGLVRKKERHWLLTVEGNVDNCVLSKRRSVATIYAFSNWLE